MVEGSSAVTADAVEQDRLEQLWRELVDLESGSHDSVGLAQVRELMSVQLSKAGFTVEAAGVAVSGVPHLVAHRAGSSARHLLLLGHLDTVWPRGTLARNPWRVEEGNVYGPGVADMKGGLAVLVEALLVTASSPATSLTVALTADEELGSPTGREVVEEAAANCDGCLVFEPGRSGNALINERRGSAVFSMTVTGRTAHAGNNPELGINAVDELAFQLLRLRDLRRPDNGSYVMAGLIEGGTARQVVPDTARALIDVRARTQTDLEELIQQIREGAGAVTVEGATVTLDGGQTRPPMPAPSHPGTLAGVTEAAAKDVGQTVRYTKAGGGSDGNFVAAMGIETIDGLGPIGHELCSLSERADLASAAERARLVVQILERFGQQPSPHPPIRSRSARLSA